MPVQRSAVGNREAAEAIFRQALADCSIEQALDRRFEEIAGGLDLHSIRQVRIVAAGKAAAPMLAATLAALRRRLSAAATREIAEAPEIRGVLIAPAPPVSLPPGFQFFAGGHPWPNDASFAGARAALDLLSNLEASPRALCLFLISGGASAMMELPLDAAIPLADTVGLYRELVHSGASITEINCVRKHFSAVKGGRLALAARGVAAVTVLVSDVPPGRLDALASGPTLPDTSTVAQCREILARYRMLPRFPASVRRFFERDPLPETPKPGSFPARSITLLTSDDLARAARLRAEALGFHAVIDNACDDWEYRDAARYLVGRLRDLRRAHPRLCLISAGEVTVALPGVAAEGAAADGRIKDGSADPDGESRVEGGTDNSGSVDPPARQRPPIGVGGRNQQFALYAASLLEPADRSTAVLSAGSDGIDGNSAAAGAVIDDRTLLDSAERPGASGPELRAEAEQALEHFDASPLLERLGSTLVTGPTGNNLRDLRILLADSGESGA
jgi:hydroxypyruvate reductase